MKNTLILSGVLLLIVGGFWFAHENTRLKVNTENETTTNIEQRYRSNPNDSLDRNLDNFVQ